MITEESSVVCFGALLKGLKDTYSWSALRAMSSEDLLVLLKRSARSDTDHSALRTFYSWIQNGLLDLLSVTPRQRDRYWPDLSTTLGHSTDVLEASIRRLDRVLGLSRGDRLSPADISATDSSGRPVLAGIRMMPLLAGGTVIILASGMALAIQITRYRQEVLRQQQATREQKTELDRVKRQLSEREKAAANPQPARSLPPTLSRPSLPAGMPDPPMPTEAPSFPSQAAASGSSVLRWNGCESVEGSGSAPQPGDTWWPVVGPSGSLEAVRLHCRGDAFQNRDGNVQIASFRDRSAAVAFAEVLSADRQHPYTFYVGEPTNYD